MADQTVALELRGDADSLIAAVNESGEAMDALAGQATDAATEIEESISGAGAAFDKYGTAVGGAMTAAGAGLEAFNRSQQDTRVIAGRVGASIGESQDAIIGLATEVHDATRDLDEMVQMMETGAQQGIDSGQALQDYAVFWDTVGDATGESAGALAGASSALRAVGIDAGREKDALAAFGFVAESTTGSIGDFLRFMERVGPELGEMNVDIDQAAALLGILEQEFGMSGRTARQEFRSAVGESDGTLSGLLETLGVTEEQFSSYTEQVAASSDVIADNAAAFKESRTPLQELQAWLDATMLKFSGITEAASMLSPVLMGAGGVIVAMNQLRQLTGVGMVTNLGRLAGTLGRIAGGAVAYGAAAYGLSQMGDAIADIAGVSGPDISNLRRELELLARTGELTGELDMDRIALAIDEIIDPSFWESAGGTISRGIDTIGQVLTFGMLDLRGTAVQYDQEIGAIDDALVAMVEGGNAQQAAEVFALIAQAIEDSGHDASVAAEAFPGYTTALDLSAAVAGEGVGIWEAASGAVAGIGDAAGTTTDELGDLSDALRAQFDPLFAATDALLANRDAQVDFRGAQLEAIVAQDELNKAVRTYGEDSPEAAAAAKRLEDAQRGVEDAQRGAVRSAVDVTTATADLKRQLDDGNISLQDSARQLDAWVDQGLITEEQARRTKVEFGLVADAAVDLGTYDIRIPVGMDKSDFDVKYRSLSEQLAGLSGVEITTLIERDAALAGRGSVHGATGGVVTGHGIDPLYLAGGGGPRGSDTVNAWLTPGEYVIRAPAVDALGLETMHRLNRADSMPMSASGGVGGSRTVNVTVNYPRPERASDSMVRLGRKAALALG